MPVDRCIICGVQGGVGAGSICGACSAQLAESGFDYRCHACRWPIFKDDEVWVIPSSGKASVERGEPYHPYCAPEEAPHAA